MYAAVLYKYTSLAVEKIRKMVAEGLSAKELVHWSNEDGFFGYGKRLRSELLNRRERILNFGRSQVNEEIKRQSNETKTEEG